MPCVRLKFISQITCASLDLLVILKTLKRGWIVFSAVLKATSHSAEVIRPIHLQIKTFSQSDAEMFTSHFLQDLFLFNVRNKHIITCCFKYHARQITHILSKLTNMPGCVLM